MKILTWDTPNFGDRLNEIVWPHYLGGQIDEDSRQVLVGIGSLLNHRLPAKPLKWVFSSGVGHGDPPRVDSTWKVLWVRGPRSAAALGQPRRRYITDGAVLLADIRLPPSSEKRYPVSFIPHCSAIEQGAFGALQDICAQVGLHLINPHSPVDQVLDQLWKSEKIITEALHGAILADAYRIPWIPVCRPGVLPFKWMDWAESLGMEYRPVSLPYRPRWLSSRRDPRLSRRLLDPGLKPLARLLLENRLKSLARHGPWQLSREGVVADKIAEMKECLAGLKPVRFPAVAAG